MSESQRKKGNQTRTRLRPEDAFSERLRDFASTRQGVTAEAELAGMWDSLTIAVKIPDDSAAPYVLELGNDLLAVLQVATSEISPLFTWSAGIYRGTELLRVLGPDSQPEWLCGMCGHTQELWLGDVCTSCRTPRFS